MDSIRTYRFRIYPDTKRQKEIDEQIELARLLYNKLLEKAKNEYQKTKDFEVKKATFNRLLKEALAENKDFSRIYSQTRQNIFVRLQRAYQNFFRRVKERKGGKKVRVGFPRFKAKGRYNSVTYPQFGFEIERIRRNCRKVNILHVSKIGSMQVELHRKIRGIIKTLTIKKEAGRYYATFSIINEMETQNVENTFPVGIDMGLETFAALSDGRKIQKPNFARRAEKRLSHWQNVIARRQKGSERRQKAKLRFEREWQHVNNESNDFIQKTTTELVESGYTSFAFEDLRIQDMLKNHRFARSIGNAVWGRFMQVLSYKAEEAGMRVVKVDPRGTSQTCSECGFLNSLNLSERVFACWKCGYHNDRDVNAARNILNRATAGHAGSHARGDLTSTVQQVSQAESLKREHTLEISGGSSRL